jgi:Na+-transporting methylmalonyl-CoA/oxaloacetate decarboxylase gamma subunit
MSQWEAWIITALGMAVVFVGLVACIGFIALFGRIAQRLPGAPAPPAAGAPVGPGLAASPASAPVPPDVIGVIAVVLDLERRLYMNRPDARVTIRRPLPPLA